MKMQCNKDEEVYTELQYDFKESVAITPYQLTYNVGDTIWLSVTIPDKKLFDEKSNSRILLESASFTTNAQLDLLYNNPFVSDGPAATFVFPPGVSAATGNFDEHTYARVTYGCSPSTNYALKLGVVLIKKGVFGLSFHNQAIQKCFAGDFLPSKLTFAFDVNDTHKQYYQQLPFASIGKSQSAIVLEHLDKKSMVVINVE
jgi:hypothetical protein